MPGDKPEPFSPNVLEMEMTTRLDRALKDPERRSIDQRLHQTPQPSKQATVTGTDFRADGFIRRVDLADRHNHRPLRPQLVPPSWGRFFGRMWIGAGITPMKEAAN